MEKDLSKLADLLGHTNVATTRIYTMESGVEACSAARTRIRARFLRANKNHIMMITVVKNITEIKCILISHG